MKNKLLAVAFTLAVSGSLAHNAAAQTPSDAIFNFRYNHIANGQYFDYFDFSASSTEAGHLNYKTFTSPNGNVVKFVDLQQYTNGANKCLDYTFSPVGGRLPDLKMWANTGTATSPNWTQLSDDSGFNGQLFPRARVWISGSVDASPTRIRLAAYGPSSNNADFFMAVLDTGQSKASCLAPGAESGALSIENGTATVVKVGP